jgi:hypothetical protein
MGQLTKDNQASALNGKAFQLYNAIASLPIHATLAG